MLQDKHMRSHMDFNWPQLCNACVKVSMCLQTFMYQGQYKWEEGCVCG